VLDGVGSSKHRLCQAWELYLPDRLDGRQPRRVRALHFLVRADHAVPIHQNESRTVVKHESSTCLYTSINAFPRMTERRLIGSTPNARRRSFWLYMADPMSGMNLPCVASQRA
jgi:hypothetical protein